MHVCVSAVKRALCCSENQRLALPSGFLNFIQSCLWPVLCTLRTVALPSATVMWFGGILLCSPVSRHLDPSQVFLGCTVRMSLVCVSSAQVELSLLCVLRRHCWPLSGSVLQDSDGFVKTAKADDPVSEVLNEGCLLA